MSILRTVSRCSPYTRAASRALIPSTKQALRTRRYISTLYIQSTFNQVLSFLIEGDRRYSFQTPHLSARPPRWYIISLSALHRGFLSSEDQHAIAQTRVLLAGCGLGSNIAVLAARTGFSRFTIADGDVVDSSNLNRQAFRVEHLGRNKAEVTESLIPS